MANRHALFIPALLLAPCLLLPACSDASRYRALKFLFDGVPEPGQPARPPGYQITTPPPGETPASADRQARARQVLYSHPPYRENRCRACHDMYRGELVRSIQEGLCVTCHEELAGEALFLHGPVAANDCTVCHHYHGSTHPQMLLAGPSELCDQCHDRADLGETPHAALPPEQSCVECHDPHGGADRFFLKRNER